MHFLDDAPVRAEVRVTPPRPVHPLNVSHPTQEVPMTDQPNQPLCHNGHPFEPGVSDDPAEFSEHGYDWRWCNVCGETTYAALREKVLQLAAERGALEANLAAHKRALRDIRGAASRARALLAPHDMLQAAENASMKSPAEVSA